MATGGLTVIRENLLYVGWAKQAAWGTDVAPTFFWRWLDGTAEEPQIKFNDEREGDTSPYETLSTKDTQFRKFTIVEKVRPITVGCALQAFFGTNSDTYTAPVQSTTLSSPVVAGATTISVAGNLGTVGTLAVNLEGDYSSATYEVVTLDLTTKTGVGPFTYTIAASGKTALAHSSAGTVTSVATHAFAKTPLTYDPYTVEFGYGTSATTPGRVIRIRDAVCYGLRLKLAQGKVLVCEHDWYGAVGVNKTSTFATPAFEGGNVPGTVAGSPFQYQQGSAGWRINALGTGNAATIEELNLDCKLSTSPEDCISEALTPVYFLPGNLTIDGTMRVQFQTFEQYDLAYYGKRTSVAADVDNYVVGYDSISALFSADAVNTFAVNLPNVRYAGGPLKAAAAGRVLKQSLNWKAIKTPSGAGATPLTVTLTNSHIGAY